MGGIVPFASTNLAHLAARIVTLCTQHLLERPERPVPVPTLLWMLDADADLAQRALDGLVGSGRLEIALFPQRFRPHIAVAAIVRVDDMSVQMRPDRAPDELTDPPQKRPPVFAVYRGDTAG